MANKKLAMQRRAPKRKSLFKKNNIRKTKIIPINIDAQPQDISIQNLNSEDVSATSNPILFEALHSFDSRIKEVAKQNRASKRLNLIQEKNNRKTKKTPLNIDAPPQDINIQNLNFEDLSVTCPTFTEALQTLDPLMLDSIHDIKVECQEEETELIIPDFPDSTFSATYTNPKSITTTQEKKDDSDEFANYVASTLKSIKSKFYRTQAKRDIKTVLARFTKYNGVTGTFKDGLSFLDEQPVYILNTCSANITRRTAHGPEDVII